MSRSGFLWLVPIAELVLAALCFVIIAAWHQQDEFMEFGVVGLGLPLAILIAEFVGGQ